MMIKCKGQDVSIKGSAADAVGEFISVAVAFRKMLEEFISEENAGKVFVSCAKAAYCFDDEPKRKEMLDELYERFEIAARERSEKEFA